VQYLIKLIAVVLVLLAESNLINGPVVLVLEVIQLVLVVSELMLVVSELAVMELVLVVHQAMNHHHSAALDMVQMLV